MQASTSTAATITAAIAAVESDSECFAVCAAGRPAIVVAVDLVTELGVVSVGTVALAGVTASGVVAAGVTAAGEAVVAECTLADAGTGKVGVELVLTAISPANASRPARDLQQILDRRERGAQHVRGRLTGVDRADSLRLFECESIVGTRDRGEEIVALALQSIRA